MKLLRIAMVNQVKKNNSDDLFTRLDKTEKKLTSSVKLVSIIIIVVLFIIVSALFQSCGVRNHEYDINGVKFKMIVVTSS